MTLSQVKARPADLWFLGWLESQPRDLRLMNLRGERAPRQSVIVVVDDDPAVLSALTFSLQVEGFTVQACANAAELLKDLPDTSARCLVIDYKLPGMNGLELLTELRHRRVAVPAILITTHPNAVVRERAIAVGAVVVEKPLLGEALFREIRAALAL